MADNNSCPSCGARRPASAPAGLCPQCLLRLGLGADLSSGSRDGATRMVGVRTSAVLSVLEETVGSVPRILLRDTEAGPETPVVRPGSDEVPTDPGLSGRYQLLGEIARGGMGAVLKGRDTDLGRDLAVKVLLDQHRDHPGLVRRFVEEAQIGGQLQHPGIVPVYELGTFDDRRPFFTMKLVKGRTLAALLEARSDPADDRPRLLGIFEQVCQTLAYAHARGVIHRDLKPSNVMVGAFGEVQVMDWGLAKVLVAGGVADDERSVQRSAESAIQTVRSGSDVDASLAGSVLGTPAYMAPEQARGQIASIDERADVFGLGAILCELLTGQPPYVGRHQGEIQRMAARAELDDAQSRLDACSGNPELLSLTRRCLAAEPKHRPRDAGEVALAMQQYLNGVQDRLRRTELARAEAQARAEEEAKSRALAEELAREAQAHAAEERRRRRLEVGLAASVLLTMLLGGAGWAWLARDRAARVAATAREVNVALDRAAVLHGQARAAPVGELARWGDAIAAARQAETILVRGGGGDALRSRVQGLQVALAKESDEARAKAEAAARDRRLLKRLEEIGDDFAVHSSRQKKDTDYAAAFREYGVDVEVLRAAEAAARIAVRPIAAELAMALDGWSFNRRDMVKPDHPGARRIDAVARAVDPDPWRNRLRDAINRKEREMVKAIVDLKTLATEVDPMALPPQSLSRLASELSRVGARKEAVALLRIAQRARPDSFWINSDLAFRLREMGPQSVDEAMCFNTAAVAIKPDSAFGRVGLALTLQAKGRLAEAEATFRDALRIKPDYDVAHGYLFSLYRNQQKWAEARRELDEVIRIIPDSASAHLALGDLLRGQGDFAGALAMYRRGHELLGTQPSTRDPAELSKAERHAALAPRLAAVIKGDDVPKDAAERLVFAQMAYITKHFAASARLYAKALGDQPDLADGRKTPYRYDAACAAVLATTGQGRDDPPPDAATKARLRAQALDWLKAEHAASATELASARPEPQTVMRVLLRLSHWRHDPDLAEVRNPADQARLPEEERMAWRAFWREVDTLGTKAEAERKKAQAEQKKAQAERKKAQADPP